MINISCKQFIYFLFLSVPSLIFNLGIVYTINRIITGVDFFNYLIFVFLTFIIYSYILNIIIQGKLIDYSFNLIYNKEIEILKLLHNAKLTTLEKYGTERFYGILEDVRVFIYLPSMLTTSFNSSIMIFICVGYLFYISTIITGILVCFILVVVVVYFVINKALQNDFNVLRDYNDKYHKLVHDSILGMKEFKLNSIRSNKFFERFLIPNRMSALEMDARLSKKYVFINQISQYSLYILLAIIFLLLSYSTSLSKQDAVSYVFILFFISGPINNLVTLQNFYSRAIVANKRIKNFFIDFPNEKREEVPTLNKNTKPFQTLKFENINFKYEAINNNESFALKNINLNIHSGEVIFIVGGNGSGKSTFINILTGLYKPLSGNLFLNGEEVENTQITYRSIFSAIYNDNYIFSNNYDDYVIENNDFYKELLSIMKMDSIVKDDKDETIRRRFSKGQYKRISLILSLLENKPILVLDEWAADQDPYFRKYFYEELIPIFKKKGKTIIAVTHDDVYFKHASRVIRFDYGEISELKNKF